MSDLALQFADFGGDLVMQGADLAADDGLRTATIISLFSDRRAGNDDELPPGDEDRRGWWGDAYPDTEGDLLGSRLWLLRREKQIDVVLVKARQYGREALQWLIDDGVAREIDVQASFPAPTVLVLDIAIHRPRQPVARYRFETFWKGN